MTTAYEATVNKARECGFTVNHIDDDCMILKHGATEIQVTFDNYSPTLRFIDANRVADGKCLESFLSYLQVRQFMESRKRMRDIKAHTQQVWDKWEKEIA